MTLREFNKHLALILDNVKDAQTDVRELQKDITGSHALQKAEPAKPTVVSIIEALERQPTATKIALVILAIVAAASGWIAKLL